MTPRVSGSDQGFVLVLVLAMLVVLSIIAGTIGAITQRLRDQEYERKTLEDAQLDFESDRATLLYLLMTQRTTIGGLTVDARVSMTADERAMRQDGEDVISIAPVGNELALDGRAYAGLGRTAFSLQDDRGLLALNWVQPHLLQQWIRLFPNQPMEPATLSNLLADYQDPDDLYRLNSAERSQYESESRRPPTNRILATPLELRAVKGWDALLSAVDDATIVRSVTLARSPVINVNTAPAGVLQALPGVDAGVAARVVAARTVAPFMNTGAFYTFIGQVPTEGNEVSLYPSDSGLLHLWVPGLGTVRSIHWTLTPWDDGGRPWREDYELSLPQDDSTNPPTLARPATTLFAGPVSTLPVGPEENRGR